MDGNMSSHKVLMTTQHLSEIRDKADCPVSSLSQFHILPIDCAMTKGWDTAWNVLEVSMSCICGF